MLFGLGGIPNGYLLIFYDSVRIRFSAHDLFMDVKQIDFIEMKKRFPFHRR